MTKFSLFCFTSLIAWAVSAEIIHGVDTSSPPRPVPYTNTSGQMTITTLAGENTSMSAFNVLQNASYKQMTATGAVKASAGVLTGIFVAASTSCTIQLHDDPDSATAPIVIDTTAAITAPAFYAVQAAFSTGLYFTETGTCNVTFFYY